MKYQSLFSVSIRHDYYPDHRCSDFAIEPTPSTQAILNDHRLLTKTQADRLSVLAPLDAIDQLFIPLADNQTLTFYLRFKILDFPSYTEIDWPITASQAESKIYRFTNLIQEAESSSELAQEVIPKPIVGHPVTADLLGLIEIGNQNNAWTDRSRSHDYQITFSAAQKHWQYYLITDSTTNGNIRFTIQDNDPTRQPQLKFNVKNHEESDILLSAIVQQFPKAQTIIFESEVPIPYRALGYKDIQLLKQSQNNQPHFGLSIFLILHVLAPFK